MSQAPKRRDEVGEVVYRRLPVQEEEPAERKARGSAPAGGQTGRKFAPTLKPLAVGFILLLVLIYLLGYFSVRELETVERNTSNLQTEQTNKVKKLLNLDAAAVSLNNEARIRYAAEIRGEIVPPTTIPLGRERAALADELAKIERLPYAQQGNWNVLRMQLAEFMETTKDLENYNQNGFVQFREIKKQVNVIEKELEREQDEVARLSEALENQSSRRIKIWWLCAMLIALLVIAATLREVQRRFRHEQQSMDEARRERHFSTQMLEGMVSAVAAIDSHARIRSANAAFFEIFPQAAIGISVYGDFASPEASRMLEAAISAPVEESTYRGRHVLDGARIFDVYSSPLDIDGEQGQIVTLVDVSEAVEAEAVLRRTEALAAVGQASAQVAHEIKNPLGSIRLGVSMLRDMTKDEEAINTIDLVERGIDHLNKLVVDVTQFSRQRPLTLSEFDLHSLLDSSLDLVTDRLHDKQTRIVKHFSRNPLRGQWDEDQLRQVFVNLLANAIDASQKNAPVTITTESATANINLEQSSGNGQQRAAKQQLARVTVTDEGSGMDEATRARIFEPFFTTKKRGTGLGLAIVKQIVEKHGGTITVHSTHGQGTRFIIDLPLKSAETETRTVA